MNPFNIFLAPLTYAGRSWIQPVFVYEPLAYPGETEIRQALWNMRVGCDRGVTDHWRCTELARAIPEPLRQEFEALFALVQAEVPNHSLAQAIFEWQFLGNSHEGYPTPIRISPREARVFHAKAWDIAVTHMSLFDRLREELQVACKKRESV